jgi:predicted dehydrogenase
MLDVGPYYVTALIHLLGPVRRVAGATRISFPERTITSAPRKGQVIRVETPTYIAGTMEFVSGPIATIIATNDVHAAHLPRIEIYGSEGSLSVPDPNNFDGPVSVSKGGRWSEPVAVPAGEAGRGMGVAEMALAIGESRPHRASGELALHALEVMLAFERSSLAGKHIRLRSACERPAALPGGVLTLDGKTAAPAT